MCAPVGVVVEFPQMDKLIDRPGVGLEIADELLVLPALLERRKAEFLVEFYGLRHRANTKRVRSQFIESHRKFLPDQDALSRAYPVLCWKTFGLR